MNLMQVKNTDKPSSPRDRLNMDMALAAAGMGLAAAVGNAYGGPVGGMLAAKAAQSASGQVFNRALPDGSTSVPVEPVGGAVDTAADTASREMTGRMLADTANLGAAALSVYSLTRPQPRASQPQQTQRVPYSESAMSRRIQSMQNPMQDLMDAQAAIAQLNLPYEQKIEYERPIMQAMEKYKTRYV